MESINLDLFVVRAGQEKNSKKVKLGLGLGLGHNVTVEKNLN